MPPITNAIVLSIIEIFIIFFAGFLSKRLKYLDDQDLKKLSKLIVYFLFPFLTINVISKNLNAEKFYELWPLPVIGFAFMVIGALVGYPLLKGLQSKSTSLQKTFLHFCVVNNFGFMPIIIISNLWGKEHLTNLFLLNIGSYIGYWTIGIAVLGESNLKSQIKNIFTPPFISILLAIILNVCQMTSYIPEFFYRASDRLGSASITMMLFVVGASMHPLPIPKKVYDIGYMLLVRNVLLPTIYIAILCTLPLTIEIKYLSFIIALMPAAFSSTVITQLYGGDTPFSIQVAITSTLLSILTIPLGLGILSYFNFISTL